jgi:hypothetical protein
MIWVMFLGISIAIAVVAEVQPVCTTAQFLDAFKSTLQGEHELVATTIFKDYTEQYQELQEEPDSDRVSPSAKLNNRLALANHADRLFDDLLETISILDTDRKWQRSVVDLRRTVLLRSRRSNNPWRSTIWVDLARFMPMDVDVASEIDSFLIKSIDDDRSDRFDALAAGLEGDEAACAEITARAMQRWSEYQKIIEPHMTRPLMLVVYPQLDGNNQVYDAMEWIELNVEDKNTIIDARTQLTVWIAINNQQQKEVITLVRRARTELDFDPWSRGCGHPSSSTATLLKNKLLQRSAEIVELNRSTLSAILQLLTPEQHILYNERQ